MTHQQHVDPTATGRRVKRRDSADGATTRERVRRRDLGEALRYQRRPDGSLLIEGVAARTGVLRYLNPDGSIRREYVPPAELSRRDSLATLARSTMTLEHPVDDNGEPVDIDPDNVSKYSTGDVDGSIVYDEAGGFVKVKVVLRKRDAIDAFLREDDPVVGLSPGYDCWLEWTPGTSPDGEEYDAIQRDRVYNHLSQVSRARGGAGVALRRDSDDVTLPTEVESLDHTPRRRDAEQEKIMDPNLLALLLRLGVSSTLVSNQDAALAEASRILDKRQDAMSDLEKMQAKLDAMEGERDRYRDELKELKEKMGDAKKRDAEIHAAAIARAPLMEAAKAVGLEDAEVAKLDNAGLRRAIVVKHVDGLPADKSDAYIEARFDGLVDAGAFKSAEEASPHRDSDPYAGLSGGDPTKDKKRRDGEDGDGKDNRRDGDDFSMRSRWHRSADDAFEAARPKA